MARKRLLTFSSDGRWRKQIHGTMRYFGRGKSKDDLRSYKEAERRYLDFLAQLERTAPIEVPTNQVTVADAAEAYLQYLHDRVEVAANQSPKNAEQPKPDTSSFGGDDPQEREGLSATSWFRSSTSINLFVAHFPADKLINAVSALDLDSFRRAIESRRNKLAPKKSISNATVKSHVCNVAHFLGWCYRRELIDRLPRNLCEFTAVRIPPPVVRTFALEELRALWSAASSRTRLYMALGLNCGFGQGDIASLKVHEWDRAAGTITHCRSKTGIEGKYPLWPITAELLRKHAVQGGRPEDLLLVGDKGAPLVHARLVNGKLKRTDAVRSAFARVQRSTGINGHRGFYSLRKTAASTIETINALVTSMFLAHSSREMKRHYALPNREALDAAVLELGKKLGIEGWPIHEGTCEATDLRRSSCHEETGQKAGQSGSAS